MPPPAAAEELNDLWGRVRDELRASVPASTFQLWLDPLRAVSAQGETLYLSAPDSVRAWVERRYAERVTRALRAQEAGLTEIGFVSDRRATAGVEGRAGTREEAALAPGAGSRAPQVHASHDFEAFVIGPSNRFAHAAALAVAEMPGEAYNPLFLHGPPGLGKTHLLGGIHNYLRHNHPALNVRYTTAESFTAEFVWAMRSAGPDGFKRRYRELDALLIDDVQVLEGKEKTEEEFVHTFNALHAAGKQIVLSSDRPPEALSRLAERLRDRFQWGLTVAIEPPDRRTRIAVLSRLSEPAAAPGTPASGDSAATSTPPDAAALRAIADAAPGNVRRLEGAMTRVLAISSMLSEPVSAPLVRRVLGDATDDAAAKPVPGDVAAPPVTAIQDAVCAVLGVTREEMLSPRRTPRVAGARQLAMYMTRELTTLSLAQIAREFDRDHSTVMHALRAVGRRLGPGSETSAALHRVRITLGAAEGSAAPCEDPVHPDRDPPQA